MSDDKRPIVVGWVKNSLIDYPGMVATVLFLSGCNLRCPFCHNPGVVHGRTGECHAWEDIVGFLRHRRGLIDGVVLTGGEPTLHGGELAGMIRRMRELGYRVKLDTNGMKPEVIEMLAPDYLALDVKTVPRGYSRWLGAGGIDVDASLEQSVELCRRMGRNAEVRITAAPRILDDVIIGEIAKLIEGVSLVVVQPFRADAELLDPSFSRLEPPSMETLRQWREVLGEHVEECRIRTRW